MKKTYLNGLLLAAVLTINSAAHADLTEKVTIGFSLTHIPGKVTTLSKSLDAGHFLPSSTSNTIYKSGDKVKVVTLARGHTATTITDLGSNTVTWLVPDEKEAFVSPSQPVETLPNGNIPSAKVVDMKQTKMILGHKAHLFRFSLEGPGFTRTGYTWITADVIAPPQSESFNPVIVDAPDLSQQFPSLRGTWLKASVVTVTPGLNAKVSAFYEVTSLSNALIPASTFAIPHGYTTSDYTKTQAADDHDAVPQPAH